MKLTLKPRHKFIAYFSCIFLIVGIQSCDKHRAKKLSGTYNCQVYYEYWDNITPTHTDSTYAETLEVTRDGKHLSILSMKVHIDSLSDERKYYYGDVHNYITVQFKDDSLYVVRSAGGLAAYSKYTYKGKK